MNCIGAEVLGNLQHQDRDGSNGQKEDSGCDVRRSKQQGLI